MKIYITVTFEANEPIRNRIAQSTFATLTFILHHMTQERWHIPIKILQHLVPTPSWRVLLVCPAGYADFFHNIFSGPGQNVKGIISRLCE